MLKNRLKERRAALGVNQQELGRMAGVSRQTISQIERGDYSPSVTLALKLAARDIFRQETDEWPVLLLDDVLSELDQRRQEFVLNRITSGQVFITCCEEEKLARLKEGKAFCVKDGKLIG